MAFQDYSPEVQEKVIAQANRELRGRKGTILDNEEERNAFRDFANETRFWKRGESMAYEIQKQAGIRTPYDKYIDKAKVAEGGMSTVSGRVVKVDPTGTVIKDYGTSASYRPNISLAEGGTKEVSYSPSEIQNLEQPQSAPTFDFKEYSERPEIKQYSREFNSFRNQGYSNKEAAALAEYSTNAQQSPTKDIQKQVLQSKSEDIYGKDIFAYGKRFGYTQSAQYAVSRTFDILGKRVDYAYNKIGLPKGFEEYQLYFKKPTLLSPIPEVRIIPQSLESLEKASSRIKDTTFFRMDSKPIATKNANTAENTNIPTSTQSIIKGSYSRVINLLVSQPRQKIAQSTPGKAVSTVAYTGAFFVPGVNQALTYSYGLSLAGRAGNVIFASEGKRDIRGITGSAIRFVKENPVEVVGAGLLAGAGAYSTFSKTLGKPIAYAKPIGKDINTFETVIFDAGESVSSAATKVRDVSPSYIAVQTTAFRDYLGMKPLSTKILAPQERITTQAALLSQSGASRAVQATNKEGAKLNVFSELKAFDREITSKDFANLPKAERFVEEKFFETGGVSVGDDLKFFVGEGLVEKGIPIAGRNVRINRMSSGGTEVFVRTRPLTVSETPKLLTFAEVKPLAEVEGMQMFKVRIAQKETRSLSPRASGNVDVSTGIVKVVKIEKPTDITDNVINNFRPQKATQKFNPPENLAAQASQLAANIPKPVFKSPSVKASSVESIEELPIIVGGRGTKSAFAGLGQYELTQEVVVSKLPPITSTSLIEKNNVREITKLKLTSINYSGQSGRNTELLKNPQLEIIKEAAAQLESQRQQEVLKTKQLRNQLSLFTPKQFIRTRTTRVPPTRTSLRLNPQERTEILKSALSKLRGFNVFTKIKGKKVIIGKNLPKGKALKKGSDYVLSNLRATFGIEESGGEVIGEDISFTPSPTVFRPSKTIANAFVQKSGSRKEPTIRGARLASLGERSEIRLAKNRKPRRLKLL